MNTAKEELVVFKKKLAIEDKKLNTSIALLKKQEEAKKNKLVKIEKEKKRKEAEKIALELAAKKEQERLLLIKKEEEIARVKKEEKERKRLALLKKQKALEEAEKRRLANKSSMSKVEEIAELEKLDLFESDQLGDELTLFRQEKKKSTKGFKPFADWFKYSLAYSSMLKNFGTPDSGREAIKGTIMINPHSYYFLGVTSSFDINSYENPYYQPDFSYSFGYSDWHMDTFSWNYSNYANNKFSPEEGEDRFNFDKGNWELSYKTKVDDVTYTAKGKYVTASDTKKLYLKAKTIVLDDVMVSAQVKHNINTQQNRLTLSAKTFLYEKFFVSGSVYEYYKPDSIGSNDGEYAYSFGWSDSRPFHPSIVYSNYYTPTRWDSDEGPKFNEGTVSIKFNLDF
ncbi:MAG: Unknown protein [uncultured Sulfurovum sp.]|uniref:Uncharacterized protein n=1 Tax=uncultured Sulfurovum sp. TaxID=269237 RepID=A0A6S6U1T1_9BACT|nr:MAG: Unknown protein [uncultured Sulfurovum sp.]